MVVQKKVTTALGVMLLFFYAGTHLSFGTYMDAVSFSVLLDRLQAVGILTSRNNISEIVM